MFEKHHIDPVVQAFCSIACSLEKLATAKTNEIEWLKSHGSLATKQDLKETEKNIMEAIQSFATKVKDSFTKLGIAVDGVVVDVKDLKDQIAAFNNSPGTLSPDDQAALDEIAATADTLANKVSGLDAQTGPAAIPTPTP
jgi:hypothetical protein